MKAKKPSKCPVCGKPIVDYREAIDGMAVAVHGYNVELGIFANQDSCVIKSTQPFNIRVGREKYRWLLECQKMPFSKAFQTAKNIDANALLEELNKRGYVYSNKQKRWVKQVIA